MNELARIAFDPRRSQRERDDAWKALGAKIESRMRYLATIRLPPSADREELIEDAPATVWEAVVVKEGYDLSRPFAPWCKTLLHRQIADFVRRRNSRGGLASLSLDAPQGEEASMTTAGNAVDDTTLDFARQLIDMVDFQAITSNDLAEIQQWPPRVQVVLLSVFDLWGRVPRGTLNDDVEKVRDRWAHFQQEKWQAAELQVQDEGKITQEEMESVLQIPPGEVANQLRRNKWRVYGLRMLDAVLEFPTAGPGFFGQLMRAGRERFGCFDDGRVIVMFSGDELETLRKKSWSKRVALLTLAGLWRRVAPDEWRQWLREAKAVAPFPPAGFDPFRNFDGAADTIAPLMGTTAAAMMTIWQQQCPKLLDLPSIKGLVRFRRYTS